MIDDSSNQDFLNELKNLLAKYNASISFSVSDCSDTHGLYDEKIVISRKVDQNSWERIDIFSVQGWDIFSGDFE